MRVTALYPNGRSSSGDRKEGGVVVAVLVRCRKQGGQESVDSFHTARKFGCMETVLSGESGDVGTGQGRGGDGEGGRERGLSDGGQCSVVNKESAR